VSTVNRTPVVAALTLASLTACGPASPPQMPAGGDSVAEPAASATAAPSVEPTTEAAPAAPAPAPAGGSSPAATLARDLLKAGGRRIAYSATKKRFLVPVETRSDQSRSLDLRAFDEEGQQREVQRVCQPGECEDRLDEIVKELIPVLAARFEKEGYESINAIGWPSGREEIDVGSLGVKLRYEKGKLSVSGEKKAPTPLRALGGRAPKGAALSAVYPVPAAKLLGVFAEGDKAIQDFYVFKLP